MKRIMENDTLRRSLAAALARRGSPGPGYCAMLSPADPTGKGEYGTDPRTNILCAYILRGDMALVEYGRYPFAAMGPGSGYVPGTKSE